MPDSPRITPVRHAERAARQARLAGALRENLRRRKEQARSRADTRDTQDAPAEPSGERRRGNMTPTG